MLQGLKVFALKRVVLHIAHNEKLNKATNILAVLPLIALAVYQSGADWGLALKCCSAPGSLHEAIVMAGAAAAALFLWFCGKFPFLKNLAPVIRDIIAEAEKDTTAAAATK